MAKHPVLSGTLFGLLVGAAATGLLYALSMIGLTSFVPLDIANMVILITPGQVATTTIENLGVWGKRLLEISGVVGFILAYMVLGALTCWLIARDAQRWIASRRWLWIAAACVVLPLALILLIQYAVPANRVNLPANSALPLAVIELAAGVLLIWMNVVYVSSAVTTQDGAPTSRRAVLVRTGAGLAVVALGSTFLSRFVGSTESTVATAPRALPTVAPVSSATPLPDVTPTNVPASAVAEASTSVSTQVAEASTSVSTQVAGQGAPTAPATPAPTAPPSPTALPAFVAAPGTRSEITEQQYLYVISSATRDPVVDVASWKLSVEGAVAQPYTLTYDELLALPRQDQTSTLECISNEVGNYLIGNCNWNGVSLRALIERAGAEDGVIDVVFHGAEGYSDSMPLAKALEATTLVVYGIDGQALETKHGFPARIRVPGLYGEKNVKWLTKIELVKSDYKGYWQQRGWTDDATIYTTSVFDTGNPQLSKNPLTRQNGVVSLGGIAFAGDRGIRKVEVQIDGGDWQEAQLKESSSDITWRFWRYDWTTEPGKHDLAVRATDGTGALQTEDEQDTHPLGATGYHHFAVEVV